MAQCISNTPALPVLHACWNSEDLPLGDLQDSCPGLPRLNEVITRPDLCIVPLLSTVPAAFIQTSAGGVMERCCPLPRRY